MRNKGENTSLQLLIPPVVADECAVENEPFRAGLAHYFKKGNDDIAANILSHRGEQKAVRYQERFDASKATG